MGDLISVSRCQGRKRKYASKTKANKNPRDRDLRAKLMNQTTGKKDGEASYDNNKQF